MSLLQGLLGFGAGAAGAFAEQKKADIDAQRQANLARLQAQYKGEVAQQQTEQTADLIGQARGGDQRASDLLTAQGVEFGPEEDERTSRQQNLDYEIRLLMGANPDMSFSDAVNQTLAGSPGTVINTGDEQPDPFAERDVELYSQAQERAEQARNIISNASALEYLLDQEEFETGAFGDVRLRLAQISELTGLDPSQIPKIGDPGAAEAMEGIGSRLAQEVYSNVLQGTDIRGSQALFDNMRRSMFDLLYTPDGNKVLTQILKSKANYDITIARKLNEYRAKYGNQDNPLFPEGEQNFYDWRAQYDATNPIFTEEVKDYINASAKNPLTSKEAARSAFNVSPQARQERRERQEPQEVPQINLEFNLERYQSDEAYARRVNQRLIEAGYERDGGSFQFRDAKGNTYRF